MDEIPKNTAWRWGEDDWKKIDPISDEKIKELDHWYDQCQSNSVMMHFCDRDYWEMRSRMRQDQEQITSLQARNRLMLDEMIFFLDTVIKEKSQYSYTTTIGGVAHVRLMANGNSHAKDLLAKLKAIKEAEG